MAIIRSLAHGRLRIFIETASGSNTFMAPAGFTDKQFEISSTTSDQLIPDDTDADLAMQIQRIVTQQEWSLSGSGVLALGDLATWRAWVASTGSRLVRIEFNDTGANGGGYYQGQAVISKFQTSSSRGDKAEISVEIQSAGAFTWTAAA